MSGDFGTRGISEDAGRAESIIQWRQVAQHAKLIIAETFPIACGVDVWATWQKLIHVTAV